MTIRQSKQIRQLAPGRGKMTNTEGPLVAAVHDVALVAAVAELTLVDAVDEMALLTVVHG